MCLLILMHLSISERGNIRLYKEDYDEEVITKPNYDYDFYLCNNFGYRKYIYEL